MNRTLIAFALTTLVPFAGCAEAEGPAALLAGQASPTVSAADQPKDDMPASRLGKKLLAAALPWENRAYRIGRAEQCMNWTREILVAACGEHFATLETQRPWDAHLLGADDELLPEHVDSLAADEFGEKIKSIRALQPGDLVFLKNTYGDWAEGVLTHVGIALGDGRYIHRMTSNHGLVKINPIPTEDFDSGIRLKDSLCHAQ
ncbi:NlpC/P60 family protein [Microbulbifer pacificus]|uniref:NlpC/P60 family protein n=1 Tax=Microbulbifer pacificus TaxID=407164 RepID=A0AAU0MVS1_9GAMM|nr:NlpC/P60 family protein [Microbulbifer pacificus]WOX04730.1 NlpC/P60 family protein [Microbulbifer pacificus]